MHLDEAASRPLDERGVAAVEQMSSLRDSEGNRVVVRFDVRNIEAENLLRDHSTTLVSNIVADQQTAIRSSLEEGLLGAITRPGRRSTS